MARWWNGRLARRERPGRLLREVEELTVAPIVVMAVGRMGKEMEEEMGTTTAAVAARSGL